LPNASACHLRRSRTRPADGRAQPCRRHRGLGVGAGDPGDLRVFVPDPPGADAYPIASYTWLLLYGIYPDADKGAALKRAVTWGLTEGQPIAEQMGYIPLPGAMVQLGPGRRRRRSWWSSR
jgi:hypothetical protein